MISRTLLTALLFTTVLLAQVPDSIQRFRDDNLGNYNNRRQGTMLGNKINTLFYNDLEIGKWAFYPTCEWPAGSGHNYLDGYTFMVGAEVTAPGDTLIVHPVETAYREQYSYDPITGTPWGFEPVSGYCNSGNSSPAISIDKTTWPAQWPPALNLTADYNGHWYGYFGKDAFNADEESYFVLDDSQDKKFTKPPYKYFPIASDSARGGLGLRTEVREFQWKDSLLQDIIFVKYKVWNISDYDYNKAVFGILCDPGIGGANLTEPYNSASYDSSNQLVYAWAPGGVGNPGNWKTGYLGIGNLGTPGNPNPVGITSITLTYIPNKDSTGAWPKNNEVMWTNMMGGIGPNISNGNIIMIIGSGPFAFKKWTSEDYTTSIIMGSDLQDLLNKKFIAQAAYNNNFVVPDSIKTPVDENNNVLPSGYKLAQNYPNPFNPVTIISYSIPKEGFVTLKVYNSLGKEIATLVNEEKLSGDYKVQFDASRLASGIYYYRINAGNFSATRKLILLK